MAFTVIKLGQQTLFKTTIQNVSPKMRIFFLLRDMCGRLHINADLSVIQKHPKNLHGSADTEGSADHSLPPLFISLNQGEHWRER